jgi:hypothetical protein
MIRGMTAANAATNKDLTTKAPTQAIAPAPVAADATGAAKAAARAAAARQVRHAADRWLTSDTITVLGQQMVLSIARYQQLHRRSPTWADAVAGVDPNLLAPITTIPDDWPLQPALWGRELRQHLMTELRRTRWITYTRTPRSLQPGDHGRGWLRTTVPPNQPAGTVPTT